MRYRQFDQETENAGQVQNEKPDRQNHQERIDLARSAVETAP